MRMDWKEKAFSIFVYAFMILFALICLLPILNIVARSLSSVSAVAGNQVWFWPKSFNPAGWRYIWERTSFVTNLYNSFLITLTGTAIAVFLSILTAYALTHQIRGAKLITALYVFVMIFDAGILPMYFQIKEYGLLNTRWSLILPTLVNPYYMFVLKKNMDAIPDSLEEAARIDGASYFRILFSVIVPVSKPAIATICVFFSVNYWNKYFDALLYISKTALKPITLYLYELIKNSQMQAGLGEIELASTVSVEIMNASAVVLTVLPILLVYPFLQRYFVKGAMAGAIKG